MKLSGIKAIKAIRESQNRCALLAIVLGAQLLNIYAISWLPLFFDNSESNLPVYQYRLISMALSLLLIWIFAPNALRFFRVRIGKYPRTYTALIFIGLILGSLIYGRFQNFSLLTSLDAIVFSLFIGLDEEFFNRAFVYGLLERVGMEFALVVSSVIFGLAHFTNFFYGDESFDYVLGHVIQAAGYGYLMVALMIATGSVWMPVAIHGLTDLRWVVMEPGDYSEIVSGSTNWLVTVLVTTAYVVAGRALVGIEKQRFNLPESWKRPLRWLGLIE